MISDNTSTRFPSGKMWAVALPLWILATACTVADEDKCVGDYSWSTRLNLCVIDTEGDAPLDSSPAPEVNGQGVYCYSDEDCAAYEANKCLINPATPEHAGICTVWDCVPEDCLGQYACCDCTHVDNPLMKTDRPFCVPDERVPTLQDVFNCPCEKE